MQELERAVEYTGTARAKATDGITQALLLPEVEVSSSVVTKFEEILESLRNGKEQRGLKQATESSGEGSEERCKHLRDVGDS